MGHHHHHGPGHGLHGHGHSHGIGHNNMRGLAIALIVTTSIMVLEAIGGIITHSLALLSDSGHMLSDAASLALSLTAIWIAKRPTTMGKTYGYHRFEVLAALVNSMTLFFIAGFILWEAFERIQDPPEVAGGVMMLIACIGLAANLLSAWVLMKQGDTKDNLNVRSAYLHVLGDALGSVGAIAAGAVMLLFGWFWADPVISVLVALLILRGAWGVLAGTIHILMEGTPPSIQPEEVKSSLLSLPGVSDVHDLHIWTITSGKHVIACHVVIEDTMQWQSVLACSLQLLENKYHLHHATIQVESKDFEHHPCDF
ncbi:cation diffusion facilitator family transporter [Marinicrinis sediminis]|uniref:Cation diffusion facilitator family transporter n=1 Tax=Marinicrinis sediminis TaxID=1652465 RepID=A0ABW5RFH8_9BACL